MAAGVDLVEVERGGWRALSEGRAGEYYRVNLAVDALMAFPFGVMDRQSAIAAMEQAPPWQTFDLHDPKVVQLTEDSGVVVYRVRAQRAGAEPYSAIVSSVFVHRDDRWLLAFHQQTPV